MWMRAHLKEGAVLRGDRSRAHWEKKWPVATQGNED